MNTPLHMTLNVTVVLQEFGGSPTLFGIASVINHMSEMAAYFYSLKIISKIGHVKVTISCTVLSTESIEHHLIKKGLAQPISSPI